MKNNLIYRSALAYIEQWYVTDRRYMGILSTSTVGNTPSERVKKLADKYMVARNFVSRDLDKTDSGRYWDEVVKCVSDVANAATIPLAEAVDGLARQLGKIFPDSRSRSAPALLSAASKFLWFSGRHDVRIYDKRAVEALNELRRAQCRATGQRGWRVNGSYETFVDAWDREYATLHQAVHVATEQLHTVLDWSIIPDGTERIAALKTAREAWFHERVFDKYLWTIGAKDKDSVGSFI